MGKVEWGTMRHVSWFPIPHSCSKSSPDEETRMTPNYSVNKIFSNEEEDSLAEYILICSKMYYGMSTVEVRKLAYEMAANNNKRCPDKWRELQMAGIEWMARFMHRHPHLSLRLAEADGSRIFNLDETGTKTVPGESRIIAERASKQVCRVTSGEKGTLVTTCAFISASGNRIPPAMVFPRVHFKEHMLLGAPPGTLGLAQPSGVFGPFQSYYRTAHDSWMTRHPGKTFSIYNVAECVGIAHVKALTPQNIPAAFKKVGIYSYDKHVFTEVDFLPCKVTDRPDPTQENNITANEPQSSSTSEVDQTQQSSRKTFISPKEFKGFPKVTEKPAEHLDSNFETTPTNENENSVNLEEYINKKPEKGDYVLVEFVKCVFYIGQILTEANNEKEVEIFFFTEIKEK
ncbi:hypothetical protein NQ315_005726 [Exocentrus adspersus]|uniref:HTH CENPB-type domain-containing protein n=1 Tax=Exocentrus adspersus TaxID=1586481 RepID=A0AAV8VI78_9CUCU|nr:hypothetical protein NQ315_005726 [Exocentrus adspersus]